MANPGLSIRARFDRKVSEERIAFLSLGGVFLKKKDPDRRLLRARAFDALEPAEKNGQSRTFDQSTF
jgi:hypothetical protein